MILIAALALSVSLVEAELQFRAPHTGDEFCQLVEAPIDEDSVPENDCWLACQFSASERLIYVDKYFNSSTVDGLREDSIACCCAALQLPSQPRGRNSDVEYVNSRMLWLVALPHVERDAYTWGSIKLSPDGTFVTKSLASLIVDSLVCMNMRTGFRSVQWAYSTQ